MHNPYNKPQDPYQIPSIPSGETEKPETCFRMREDPMKRQKPKHIDAGPIREEIKGLLRRSEECTALANSDTDTPYVLGRAIGLAAKASAYAHSAELLAAALERAERPGPQRKLSPAQARMLRDVREDGERTYNGLARKTVEKLESLGLVTSDFELVPHDGGRYTERFTVRPSENLPGPALLAERRDQPPDRSAAAEIDALHQEVKDELSARVWDVAARFGAARGCPACDKVVRRIANGRDEGHACAVHGGGTPGGEL